MGSHSGSLLSHAARASSSARRKATNSACVEPCLLPKNSFWKSLLSTARNTSAGSVVDFCTTCVEVPTETTRYCESPARSPGDEEVTFRRNLNSEVAVGISAELFWWPHYIAEPFTPAGLAHGVLEPHFVDLLAGREAHQLCEHPPESVARGVEKSV